MGGMPKLEGEGDFIPVREAVKKTGFSRSRIYQLINQGIILTKKKSNGVLIYYHDLLSYKAKTHCTKRC